MMIDLHTLWNDGLDYSSQLSNHLSLLIYGNSAYFTYASSILNYEEK